MAKKKNNVGGSNGGFFYFAGFLGAAVYYFQTGITFADYFWGFLKALLWPAFLVYEAFSRLGA